MPHFNDSRREWELSELCATCGHRNGLHSMANKCPMVQNNGRILRHEFQDTEFAKSGKYQMEAA
jgi:hypothetical protein